MRPTRPVIDRWAPRRRPPPRRGTPLLLAALLLASACATYEVTAPRDPTLAATVEEISLEAMTTYKLKSMIVRVTMGGSDVYTGAFGVSMTGVPATTTMRFRNGAFAYSYLGYITAQLAAEGVFSVDDTIDRWVPELPRADQVTVGDLPHSTSGYSDYVYSDEVSNAVYLDPFRQWTSDELIQIGVNGRSSSRRGRTGGTRTPTSRYSAGCSSEPQARRCTSGVRRRCFRQQVTACAKRVGAACDAAQRRSR